MKDELLLNDNYFNYEKLRLNESKFRVETANEAFIIDQAIKMRNGNQSIGLIAEPGYGVYTSFLKYVSDFTSKNRYYLLEPKKGEKFQTCLAYIVQQDIPPFIVKFQSAQDTHLINSITHLFKGELSKKRLILIYNIQNLNDGGLASLGLLIKSLKNVCGIILSVDPSTYAWIQKRSAKETFLRDLLTDVNAWVELAPPTTKELGNLCIQRGILARKVIDELLKNSQDFKMLNVEIDKVRTLLKDKGRM